MAGIIAMNRRYWQFDFRQSTDMIRDDPEVGAFEEIE
jgi:hypothetical protein